MKSFIIASLILIVQPGYASDCDVFVGKWKGQCKTTLPSETERNNFLYEYETEITKVGECAGLKLLGEVLYFNKLNKTETKKNNVVRTRQSSLRWLNQSPQAAIEIFNSTIDTSYAPGTDEIIKTESWKNNYELKKISPSELSLLVKFQENFSSVDVDHCDMHRQK